MTPEKQRIAIAEACGYTHVRIVKSLDGPPDHCIGHHPAQPHSIPDYLNDLNAMHEVEKACIYTDDEIDSDLIGDYLTSLVIAADSGRSQSATAAQRAEAFLRTLGKWEESK
jgi:hypothetical protein